MTHLVWFRSDLRAADNPALHAASNSSTPVVGLFIDTPRQWAQHDWGDAKIDFVRRSVGVLEQQLARLGIPMLRKTASTFAEVPEVVLQVLRETDSAALFANRELEVNERRRDQRSETLVSADFDCHWFDEQTLVRPGRLTTMAGKPYSVFTPFYRSWCRELETAGVDLPLPAPAGSNPIEPGPTGDSSDESRWAELWPAGEAEAERRLERFLDQSSRQYAEQRDEPSENATSGLSPYLAAGSISVRTLLCRGLERSGGDLAGGDPGVTTWLKQLAWRDFYRHVLISFPRVSKNRPFQLATETIEWENDPQGLLAWQQGQTGFPIVDAAMRALSQEGWMHNRLRMITASFLTKDLLIDWRLGERFFSRSLIDTDLANNNGGWQWAASTGTDAAPYFRVFNPWRQSERFDPQGSFITRWIPELKDVPPKDLHDPKRLARVRPSDYPAPIVDHRAARVRAIEAFKG